MQGILVNISDHPTLPLKRKQEVICFKTHWVEETVEVFLRLHHYTKNGDNSYGDEITSPSISNYESKLTASNVRKVDPTNGIECYSESITIITPTEFEIKTPLETRQLLVPEDQWIDGEPTFITEVVEYSYSTEIRDVVSHKTVYKRITDNTIVENVIGQFDFFNLVIQNQPVLVGQMLTQFVQIDDQVKGKWNK